MLVGLGTPFALSTADANNLVEVTMLVHYTLSSYAHRYEVQIESLLLFPNRD